ncbi:CaiB/BaiF CoA-transferase family protein [Salinisphaera sp. P385]|uniref:CaiB/BaiF CoA-transferase family protein n=1 Tax=Spectribacter acetivorans TaxID=3075603 RepID=A0ABU3BBM9_9GAMM|nr:CaiB/BaiF CoA-transferase family protein [Salinisphaera sp. P385]MDT0619500.1 CaiB/BaiF CoA-transferase family protein [Salinisphaera sp. P385]
MGPLEGTTVIELAGLGPAPMAGMMLADMGARVIRVERGTRQAPGQSHDASLRGKQSIALNLKTDAGLAALLRLIDDADALIEGFRPGVAERLGVGPEVCRDRNPRLVYGRMTGWGQDGPLAQAAGHDINYIALSGALHAIGEPGGKPVIPLNLVGDMGGGGMLLAFGVVCALFEAARSGEGQVVDAAMVDGTAQQLWMQMGMMAAGLWNPRQRSANLLDGGAPFYQVYETADGGYVALGALEPQFYAELVERAGLDPERFGKQMDTAAWPDMRAVLAEVFLTRTRDQWCAILEGTDACFAPVLAMDEAARHPHNAARGTFLEVDGWTQPAPAPRLSRTPGEVRHGQHRPGADGVAVLRAAGFEDAEIDRLRAADALLEATPAS